VGAEPQTQVSQSDLIAAVQRIEDAALRLRAIQRNLDNAGIELKHSWVGQSEAAFAAVHKIWHERFDKVMESLQRLAENITTSNKNYVQFNQERAEATNKIAAAINAGFNSRL
jgi:WXG100 family type VII secretion target